MKLISNIQIYQIYVLALKKKGNLRFLFEFFACRKDSNWCIAYDCCGCNSYRVVYNLVKACSCVT